MMKKIRFMDTSLRDGFQSVFGARALTDDFIPAVEVAVHAGIEHLEAGGGARFQALFMYCGESAFDMMDRFRAAAGPACQPSNTGPRHQCGGLICPAEGYDRSSRQDV